METTQNGAVPTLKKFASYALPVVVGGGFLYLTLRGLPLREFKAGIGNLIERLQPGYLVAAGVAYLVLAVLHGLRFRTSLRHFAPMSLPQAFGLYAIATLLNTFMPARAGDLYKPLRATRLSQTSFASALGLAMTDLILWGLGFVLWMALIAVVAWERLATLPELRLAILAEGVGGIVGLVLFAALAGKFRTWKEPQSAWIKRLWSFLQGMYATLTLKTAAPVIPIALAGWLCEIGIAYAVAHGFGLSITFAEAALVMAAVTTAMIIPAPGGLGPFEAAGTFVFGLYGAPKAEAAIIAICYHMVFIVLPLIVGAVCFAVQAVTDRNLPKPTEPAGSRRLTPPASPPPARES